MTTKQMTTMTTTRMTVPMQTKSMVTRKSFPRRSNADCPRQLHGPKVLYVYPLLPPTTYAPATLAPIRHASSSDSDSDYGARAHKKKKKARPSADEVRVSSRGGKVPNYVDDVQDFEKFEDDDEGGENTYFADPNQQYQEEDEIEAVLNHSRDEGREDDTEDLWFENVVCLFNSMKVP